MQETSAVVIVAAGASRRMQGLDKLWMPLAGRITLARTIDVFQNSPLIDTIILVTNTKRVEPALLLSKEEGWQKIAAVVAGGARRQDSVRIGLDILAHVKPDTRWVMIHDAARPLVTPALLETGLETAYKHQAAIAAVPVKDTIKEVRDGKIEATPDRSQLWTVQTPQVFSFPLIYEAHHSTIAQENMTDDATLLERLGHPVTIFSGSYSNIKITTQEDILLAEALMRGKTV
jgi:2-C-methyl-D-erythritol 4-phosphate cytidylyltransferase